MTKIQLNKLGLDQDTLEMLLEISYIAPSWESRRQSTKFFKPNPKLDEIIVMTRTYLKEIGIES